MSDLSSMMAAHYCKQGHWPKRGNIETKKVCDLFNRSVLWVRAAEGEWNARLSIRNSHQQEEKGANMQFPTARALQHPPPYPCQCLNEQQIAQTVTVPSSVHSSDPLVSSKPRHALVSRSTLFRNSAVGSLRSRGSGGGKQLDGKGAAGRVSSSPLCALAMDDVVSRAGESEGSGGGQPWTPISQTAAWNDLKEHVKAIEKTHLRFLLHDEERCEALIKEHDGVLIDFTRQRVTGVTLEKLLALADTAKLKSKIDQMFGGVHINSTEDRPVLHTALRAPRDEVIGADGKNVVPEVWEVLDKIETFSNQVRSGQWVGATGRPLTDVVAIGIGGSFLGPLFVHTAFRTEQHCADASHGRKLRFLANVDPIDVSRALSGLHQETTLVVVVSKTFTTSETMLNARTVRTWITSALGEEAVSKHMVAVSTNLKLVKEFGIDPANAFGFWDWVGGRYSVTSAVGVLPLALQYGFGHVVEFLKGAWSVDNHFRTAPLAENLPVLLGLLSIWNVSFLGCPSRAILPYCQALQKLAPHIQQVSMESNGKGVSIEGHPLPYGTGEVDFGEPGTNGQHSFYQLIHQGRIVPCEFIGIIKSQQSVYLKGEQVSNHDELMCNFFAQADALAYGKTREECDAEGIPEDLIPHKMFTGNRPSLSILLPSLTPYTTGQLLSLYENRVAVQGWIWGINSFDQWGVELGKSLAKQVRSQMAAARTRSKPLYGFNYSTTTLLTRYLEGKTQLLYPEPHDVFPSDILPGKEK